MVDDFIFDMENIVVNYNKDKFICDMIDYYAYMWNKSLIDSIPDKYKRGEQKFTWEI